MDIGWQMERTLNENKIDGSIFACKCGNTEFDQECFVKSVEIVVISKKDEHITIISKDMKEVAEEDIEYNNNFMCPKCGAVYEIISKDGTDMILDTNVGEDNAD